MRATASGTRQRKRAQADLSNSHRGANGLEGRRPEPLTSISADAFENRSGMSGSSVGGLAQSARPSVRF
jgi:hypothetical protein